MAEIIGSVLADSVAAIKARHGEQGLAKIIKHLDGEAKLIASFNPVGFHASILRCWSLPVVRMSGKGSRQIAWPSRGGPELTENPT